MPPKKPKQGDTKAALTPAPAGAGPSNGKGKSKAAPAQLPTATTGKGKATASGSRTPAEDPDKPRELTAKEIIGGLSWTGKLPQTLFYELTVREHWEKPDYTMNRSKQGFQSTVIIKMTNPKTKEKEEVRFKAPDDVDALPLGFPTALEARHYAATWALFRVASAKNLQLMLPPTYRDYWREFQEIKKVDETTGKSWRYNADPFLTQREHRAAEAEREKTRLKRAEAPSSSVSSQPPKGWERVPSVDMGQKARQQVEKLVRSHHVWNTTKSTMDLNAMPQVMQSLHQLGFRFSHAEEACEWTRNREEALEWLLIHVPEDDLPPRFLPDNYTAGAFAFVPESLSQEYAAKRLARTGYSIDLAREALAVNSNDEPRAAESLMQMLLSDTDQIPFTSESDLMSFGGSGELEGQWNEEHETLQAIFGDRFKAVNDNTWEIILELQKPTLPKNMTLEIRKPSEPYPANIPTIALLTEPLLPAHVRLSIIKQTAEFATGRRGESMIFDLIDWLESNLERIVERPGKLRNVTAGVTGVDESVKSAARGKKRPPQKRRPIDWTPGLNESLQLLSLVNHRQMNPELQKMMKIRQSLPAWKLKDDIVEAIKSSQVVIISGETGSGKSTQSVQFVLDDLIQRELSAAAKILCTQPRRISALGLADRVSAERCTKVGEEVGYAIRGESKMTRDTKITFMTTGVLLRRLQSGDGLEDVSHVFVDEVHERSLDTDFLLILLKRMLPKRKDFKIVLMSATLDAEVFANFFGGAVVINIEGRTHPVMDYWIDSVIKFTNFDAHQGPAKKADEETIDMEPSVGAAIRSLGDRINYDLIAATVNYIDRELNTNDGAILIFLPGTMEISRALSAIKSLPQSYSRFHALPLHASLMPAEQRLVFPKPPKGKRKVICATNVAETSITIEDVVSVIDTGKVKETTYDAETSMIRLAETWASRAACKQRRGRAGRVRIGNCYKLFTRHTEEKRMQERPDPEILRIPLENLCLSVKAMGVKDVRNFLGSALTPPNANAVEEALSTLRKIGAVNEEELTGLGRHLSTIPADLRCAKLMIYGAMFGCVDAALTIASILTARSPFLSPMDKRDESKVCRQKFARGNGDLLADFRAYEEWQTRRKASGQGEVRRWCEQNFLSYNTLNDIFSNISQYTSSLQETGFLPFSYHRSKSSDDPMYKTFNSQNENDTVIRAIVAGAFNPNIARIGMPEKRYAATMSGAKELDPEAKTIKYYTNENGRVFLHPSATLFDAQSFVGNSTFMAFASKMATQKLFIRDITPINSYSLLLFGGDLQLDVQGRGLVIDGWLRIRGYPRIGCLINRLRVMLDEALEAKVEDPAIDLRNNEVVRCVRKLIEWDGMDAP